MAIRTVGDLVAELSKMPQNLPVLVGCHYDNDNALTDQVAVNVGLVAHSEGEFHLHADPSWAGAFQAVTVE